jgi:hypothetical protein
MTEEWKGLEEKVLSILKDGVSSFSDDIKSEAMPYLREKAKQIAREKWASINAATDAEKETAKRNLEHLSAQVEGEIIRLKLAATDRAKDLLGKVFDVAIDSIIKIVPKLLKP